jgi:hypothetical protein
MYAASSPGGFVGFDDQEEAVRRVDRSEKLAADVCAVGCEGEIEGDALADEGFQLITCSHRVLSGRRGSNSRTFWLGTRRSTN